MKKILFIAMVLVFCLTALTASAQEEIGMAHEGIGRVCVSVFDLEESRTFFEEKIGLTLVGEGELAAEEVRALYGLDCPAKYAMLKNDVQITMIELIEFANKPEKTSREGYNSWDYGYYDVALRCEDIDKVYEDFKKEGYTFLCPPYQYTTTWSNATVFEAVMQGPNGMPLAMINKTEKTPAFEGMFRNFPDVVLVVDDMATADSFYVDVLNLKKAFDMEMAPGLVDPIVGTAGTDIITRIAMYAGEATTPIVEILDFSEPGVSMTEAGASVPSNAGTFATSFRTDDLTALLARASEKGFEAMNPPVEMKLAPYGAIRSAMILGPNGSLVEFFEVIG